jgi:hypothetical protein
MKTLGMSNEAKAKAVYDLCASQLPAFFTQGHRAATAAAAARHSGTRPA